MVRVLKGEKPGDIPVEGIKITELVVNPKAAASMGVTIPDAVVKRAKTVVRSSGSAVEPRRPAVGARSSSASCSGSVALGVFLSFRVLAFPDLTVDGSFPLGAAVAATAIVGGIDP